ncbi:MAG TPA: ATP-binding protein, partial [Burkholderiaceae bacterium]|nr:ATP-binding protein [Burkholderiaceae bacterium]
MTSGQQSPDELRAHNAELRLRLQEAEDTLLAIRSGGVDAFVIGPAGAQQIYTLEGAERPYRMWVEKMQQGAATLERGLVTYCNQRMGDLVGVAPEALLGRPLREFIDEDHHVEYDALLMQGLAGVGQAESCVQRRDGNYVPVLLTVNPLSLDGASLGVLATDLTVQKHHDQLARALSERERLDAELRQVVADLSESDRRKSEFLAMLSHELRNPLAPISNTLQILSHGDALAPQARATLEVAQRHVRQMVRLVDDLLDVSRVSHGRIELRKEAVELTSIARQAVESVRPLAAAAGLQLDLRARAATLWVHADPARLAQAIGNLLHNAIKFTPHGGRVGVTVERDGADGVLRVTDDGIGLASDQLSRVFELFTQIDSSLDRAQGGLGIGLALVKALVQLHGGTVEARSAGLGRGSEFTLRLPALESPAVVARASPVQAAGARSRRVLVVDDNRDAADSMAALLKLGGHQVAVAYDGLAAVEVACSGEHDLVLLDIGLPKLDGLEAARRIRQRCADSPRRMKLVALTGWGQSEDRQRSRASGFDHHLV